MVPADAPVIPSITAIRGKVSYEKLISLTLLDYHAIKQNKACLISTIRECLSDLYKRASIAELTPCDTSLGSAPNNTATCSTTTATTNTSYDSDNGVTIFWAIILTIVGVVALVNIIEVCCCTSWKRKRQQRLRLQREQELESGAGTVSDANQNRFENDISYPGTGRREFWSLSRPSRRPVGWGSSRKSASTGRPESWSVPHLIPRIQRITVPVPAVRRPPSAFDGVEGHPLPPPLYEMREMYTLYEEHISEPPAYSLAPSWWESEARSVRLQSS